MDVCMYVCMYGWMDGCMNGCMDERKPTYDCQIKRQI